MCIHPFALDETARGTILAEMRRWKFDNIAAAVNHFAYRVPEGKKFTQSDCEWVLDQLDLDSTFVIGSLAGMIRSRLVLQKLDSALGTQVYCLERRTREQYKEGLKKFEHTPEPERREVSSELKTLSSRVTDAQEATFLEETVRCLEVSANRAAIVMAWNLAFYHLRTWILTHHLAAFSGELTSRYRTKTKFYDPVTNHDDFPDGEWFVLEICRAAGFLDNHRFGILEGALKKRNRYAHPSPAKVSGPEATGYVAELLKNVLLDPYFA
jgi:hypothetical protein